ncbi:hypothetical protein ACFSSC_05810 [Corynebacterium mendelii]|uniref:Uncharacterized protein n=1 Tax=Corynebacterium mendelii TaxID=2765362 RepID=A0A939E078_9CORY|nr:hypothetical protein [Corynebacterium mendelii]MBN9643082.1 hypothetical protein [Corynebacterium mendelii]
MRVTTARHGTATLVTSIHRECYRTALKHRDDRSYWTTWSAPLAGGPHADRRWPVFGVSGSFRKSAVGQDCPLAGGCCYLLGGSLVTGAVADRHLLVAIGCNPNTAGLLRRDGTLFSDTVTTSLVGWASNSNNPHGFTDFMMGFMCPLRGMKKTRPEQSNIPLLPGGRWISGLRPGLRDATAVPTYIDPVELDRTPITDEMRCTMRVLLKILGIAAAPADYGYRRATVVLGCGGVDPDDRKLPAHQRQLGSAGIVMLRRLLDTGITQGYPWAGPAVEALSHARCFGVGKPVTAAGITARYPISFASLSPRGIVLRDARHPAPLLPLDDFAGLTGS